MKVIFSLFFFLFINGVAFPQTKSQLKKNYWTFFYQYEENFKLICDHWTENFRQEIYGELTGDSEENYHSLLLDSYGGIYPKEELYENFSDESFYGRGRKHYNLLNNSHFGMFRAWDLKITNPTSPFKALNDSTRSKKGLGYRETFYDIWEGLTLDNEIEAIRQKLDGKKKIVFFIHGYNVPYSLAVVQANAMMDEMIASGVTRDEVLLVPVFWPSNNQKKHKFKSGETFPLSGYDSDDPRLAAVEEDHRQYLNDGKANISNFIRPSNGKRFTAYSNQAYYAAITLRKILLGLSKDVNDKELEVQMICHSLGATIATSSLINTSYKLYYKGNEDGSNRIRKALKEIPIPAYPIKVFMSAPAIPGVSTFIDMDTDVMRNKVFFSTVNPNDKSLNKKYVKGLRFPWTLSATTLGMNYNSDAGKTRMLFNERGLTENFVFKQVSDQVDHNMFSYLLQPGYRDFIQEFLNY